jgi:hypothetical protein
MTQTVELETRSVAAGDLIPLQSTHIVTEGFAI